MIKKLLLIILIILLISPGLASLTKPGFYHTHDGELHMARFTATFKAFKEGQIIPRWASKLNFGYGHPVFIFQYPLPNYLASIFLAFGFKLETTFKLLIIFSSITSVLLMFHFSKTIFNKNTAFLCSLVYFFLPYHFLNIYLRGSIGEIIAFAFLPLVFLSLTLLFKKTNLCNLAFFSISYSLLILAHNGLAFISTFFLFGFSVLLFFQKPKNRAIKIKYFIFAITLALGLTAFFWIPFLGERKFIKYEQAVGQKYLDHFVFPNQLITPNWGYGTSEPGKADTMSFQIGLVQIALTLLSLIIFPFLSRKQKQYYFFFFLCFIFSIFFMLPASKYLWKIIPVLPSLQFPWRFLFIVGFTSSILAGFLLDKINSKIIFAAIFLLLLVINRNYWHPDVYYPVKEEFLYNFPGNTTWFGENDPIWQKEPLKPSPISQFETNESKVILQTIKTGGIKHHAKVRSPQKFIFTDNTLYFPGWEAKIDGQKTAVYPSNSWGLIQLEVPAGEHNVEISFHETLLRLISDIISLISLLLLLGISIKGLICAV